MTLLRVRSGRSPLFVVMLYIISGLIWCALADILLPHFFILSTPSLIACTIRILGFVLLSGICFYLVLRRTRANEDQFRSLVDSAPLPILVYDGQRWTHLNSAALELLGVLDMAHLCVDPVQDIVHPDDKTAVYDLLRRTHYSHTASDLLTCRLMRADGGVIDTELRAMSIVSGGKTLVQMVVHDVTERKRMEEALLFSQARLSQALQVGHMGYWDWDMVTGKRTWSEEKCRIFGIESFDGRFETLIGYIHPDDRDRVLSFLGQAATAGKGFEIEYRIIRPNDGATRVVHVRSKVILNEFNQPCMMTGTIQDVTDNKVADELLLQSEKLAAVGQLAAGVAHEIRNPLTSLKGFLQLLPTSPPDVQSRFCGIMRDEIVRIATIVDGLLFLAKPQTVRFRLTDLRETLTEVVALLSTQATLESVQISTDFQPYVPQVWGEENQLKQVFINLAKNAIESMPNGGTLTIRLHASDRTIEIEFSDQGTGIPQDALTRLGDPFYTTKEQGTGLGLAVSRNIIQSHQGRLHIESEVGEGTTVRIQLPVVNLHSRFV